MHHVILRDDDTNALTPTECLERLYRPFLDRGFPVNLAVIPNVGTNVSRDDGSPEGYLLDWKSVAAKSLPIGGNQQLVGYLRENRGYRIAQHGYQHTRDEFDSADGENIARRLDHGTTLLVEAGFDRPRSFIAPYDKISRRSYVEISRRFGVISTGWFESRRLPFAWWPGYILKRLSRKPHWRVGSTLLLSHPGCLLSYRRPYETMFDRVQLAIRSQPLTVLVTHWWEYFRENRPDERFIGILHEVAKLLDKPSEIKVTSFDALAAREVEF
nr:DUF2334 domain-containing protein [Verrucomicrobiota bacterium]